MIALAGNFTANPLEILRPSGFVALLGRGCDLVVLSKLLWLSGRLDRGIVALCGAPGKIADQLGERRVRGSGDLAALSAVLMPRLLAHTALWRSAPQIAWSQAGQTGGSPESRAGRGEAGEC